MPIVNITATFTLGPLDFDEVKQLPCISSEKRNVKRKRITTAFDQVIIRQPHSRVVFLLYRTNKCVCLGARSEREVQNACDWLGNELGVSLLAAPVINNMVYAFASKHGPIRLETLFAKLQKQMKGRAFGSFEPELSPALIYIPKCCPRAKALIFRPGKVNITGLRTLSDAQLAASEIEHILEVNQ